MTGPLLRIGRTMGKGSPSAAGSVAASPHPTRASLLVVTLAFLLPGAGCGDDGTGADAGETPDLGPMPRDASSSVDAEAPTDAESTDGSGPGPAQDAGDDLGALADAGPAEGGCGQPVGARDERVEIRHDGSSRSYLLHLPPSYDGSAPMAVVLGFHGRTLNATSQESISDMNAAADREGLISVHPEGIGSTWNAGACCGDAMTRRLDDVGFVGAVIDMLERTLCIDPDRVYATGLSNGGMLAHRLACELSDRIAAIAPVAGTMAIRACSPGRPVPVLAFHGTADALVPYRGGFAGIDSVPATMAGWVERNGCEGDSVVDFANGDVRCETWAGCDEGASVRLCTVDGGGHQWPGGSELPFLGPKTDDISATDAALEFFAAHSR